jgi:hypothetical protein
MMEHQINMARPEVATPSYPQFRTLMRDSLGEHFAKLEGMVADTKNGERFKGPMELKVGMWRREGIGKVILAPIRARKQPNSPERLDRAYEAVAYVLPLTDESIPDEEARVLFVIPTDSGCSYMIAGPRKERVGTDEEKKIGDAENARTFVERYISSTEPYYYEGPWNTTISLPIFNKIYDNSSVFGISNVERLVNETQSQAAEDKALVTARIRKSFQEDQAEKTEPA